MGREIRITVSCEKFRSHAKILRLRVDPKVEKAQMELAGVLARLLDGTSPMYIHTPGEGSPIGLCGICGSKVKCDVEEVD
jgi:hypothetical protein